MGLEIEITFFKLIIVISFMLIIDNIFNFIGYIGSGTPIP